MKLLTLALASTAAFSTFTAAGSCASGVSVCCGSASVKCVNDICKACCGSTCGCWYSRGNKCSSDSSVVPCVDLANPDFALTNGECKDPNSASGAVEDATQGVGKLLHDLLAKLGLGR
ncbi:hypothetical protein B0A50_04801 [Salinomyces thailandicus]|uniref:Uncharacterized protein n=1 Tax=Salinomyces thailandicus TaxID=706561 RepID=A0A4U0TWB9_9PEZI|nr:hypothetical protein B0A50_04801 [Salinomyces thailandica]